jgi:hypothetical protein
MVKYLDGVQQIEITNNVIETTIINAISKRDTTSAFSDSVNITGMRDKRLVLLNQCNQQVILVGYWSPDNVTWYSMGQYTINANTNVVYPDDNMGSVLTGLFTLKGFIRFQYSYSTAPTSGTITALLQLIP